MVPERARKTERMRAGKCCEVIIRGCRRAKNDFSDRLLHERAKTIRIGDSLRLRPMGTHCRTARATGSGRRTPTYYRGSRGRKSRSRLAVAGRRRQCDDFRTDLRLRYELDSQNDHAPRGQGKACPISKPTGGSVWKLIFSLNHCSQST